LAPVIVIAVALAAVVYGRVAAEGRLAAEIGGVAGPEMARKIAGPRLDPQVHLIADQQV
jgi:hypothetical protein